MGFIITAYFVRNFLRAFSLCPSPLYALIPEVLEEGE
jgi:hypothetical protein